MVSKHAVVAVSVLLSLLSSWASAQQAYRLTDLGTLGDSTSVGAAINDSGQVTGYAFTPNNTEMHAFLSDGVTLRAFGTFGGTPSQGYAINASSRWPGVAYTTGDTAWHAFLSDGATTQDLGTLGGTTSVGFAINDAGQVTGLGAHDRRCDLTRVPVGRHDHPGPRHVRRFDQRWHRRRRHGASDEQAFTTGDAERHAFLWDGTLMRDLGTFGGTTSEGSPSTTRARLRAAGEHDRQRGLTRVPVGRHDHRGPSARSAVRTAVVSP